MEPAFFDALLVGFARSVLAFLGFDGGKTAVFSRREQVVGSVKNFYTPVLYLCVITFALCHTVHIYVTFFEIDMRVDCFSALFII